MRVAWISSAVAWHSRFSRPSLSPANRVLTELVSKMKDMQMDKSELGCLRAIVLFNPGDRVTSAVPTGGPQAPATEDTGRKPALGEGGVSASGPPLPLGKSLHGAWSGRVWGRWGGRGDSGPGSREAGCQTWSVLQAAPAGPLADQVRA